MGSYATLGAVDLDQAHGFYDAVLAAIGWRSHADFPGWRGYSEGGSGEGFVLWICTPFDGQPAAPGNGAMTGFLVSSREQVDAFYRTAMDHGGTDDGAPGPRPHYGPTWYAAYLRDPSGNKLAAVYNG